MFIRLLSDIHLELSTHVNRLVKRLIPNVSIDSTTRHTSTTGPTILVLAGDIGNPFTDNYKMFLSKIARHYDHVFVVTGNHEYYQVDSDNSHLTMDEVNKFVALTAHSIPNVHFLNHDSFIINKVRFLGCTLWTKSDPKLAKYMNDYNRIPWMTPALCQQLHDNDVAWLCSELDKDEITEEYNKTVVITHHLPSYKIIADKYRGDPMNSFFATNLDDLVKKADIWCCGHSHTAKLIKIGKCECYLNPVGYSQEFTGFNAFIEIPIN